MARRRLNIVDEMALSRLAPPETKTHEPSHGDWIRILRDSLRMTQAELASRAKITQPHLAGIESGKTDPQISTLKRIFEAMSAIWSLSHALESRSKKCCTDGRAVWR